MSVKELMGAIDKVALLNENGLFYPVLIKDAKISYGQARYLISPVGGKGEAWVNDNRIKF